MLIDELPRLSDTDLEVLTDHAAPPAHSPDFEQWRDERIVEIADERAASLTAGIRNDESSADDIRIFLAGVKPMNGIDNVAYWSGRSAVERLAVAEDTGNDSLRPTLAQCVDVLSFLTAVEPVSPATCACAGNREPIGLNLVLDEVSMRIQDHLERGEKPPANVPLMDGKSSSVTKNEPLLAELRKAMEAVTHVDALVSTVNRAIVSGDYDEDDLILVLDSYAWPQIEATRVAIEAALSLAGDPVLN